MDWLQEHAWETWLALTILLGVAEMVSLDLILIMLAAGAFVGMLTALLGLPIAAPGGRGRGSLGRDAGAASVPAWSRGSTGPRAPARATASWSAARAS